VRILKAPRWYCVKARAVRAISLSLGRVVPSSAKLTRPLVEGGAHSAIRFDLF
jgi:hypothetical protein